MQEGLPCPTCGRAAHDWKTRPDGTKDRQHWDGSDRTQGYRDWHRRALSRGCMMIDMDAVELRRRDGVPVPVAVTELTRIDGDVPVGANYLRAIQTRYFDRDAQGALICLLADRLRVPAYVVLFAKDLTAFYILHLARRTWSRQMSEAEYCQWPERLPFPDQGEAELPGERRIAAA